MKKAILILSISFVCYSLSAQPDTFSWATRHGHDINDMSYISDPQNQLIQGPCHVFASVAAVEAMAQIYYNKLTPSLNLSESNLYNADCGLGCGAGESSVDASLTFIQEYGIVDDDTFEYPCDGCGGSYECPDLTGYNSLVNIPKYTRYTSLTTEIEDNTDLKKAIMDYGPVIVTGTGTDEGGKKIGHGLRGDGYDYNHSFLIIGWGPDTDHWIIKDSWPNDNKIDTFEVDLFAYSPHFIRVHAKDGSSLITCAGANCSIFNIGDPLDDDEDGFYNWGLDTQDRPAGWPGPDLMDFNDGDNTKIFRTGYNTGETAPTLTGGPASGYLCPSGTRFNLNNLPEDFDVEWEVTPAAYFSSPQSGDEDYADIDPISLYIGKECEITFTISHDEDDGEVEYKEEFIINGPLESQVSFAVEDAYGGSPPKYGGVYYLCPNSTYYIYYYNTDQNCTTSDFEWVVNDNLPYGWTKYWSSNNMVAINTNNYPTGTLEVKAETSCCSPNDPVTVYTQYFDEDEECGEYFRAFPNPTDNYVNIDVIKEKMAAENISLNDECIITMFDKTGIVKYKDEFKGFPYRINTSNLPKGLYFINLLYNGKMSSIRLVVEH